MLLRYSSIGRRDRSSQRITIGIRVCLPGFPCRAYPWSWAYLVSDSERQLARYLRRNLARPQPVGSLRRPIRLPILLRQRRLRPGLAPRRHRPLFLHLRPIRIRRRTLPHPSPPTILRPPAGFPRLQPIRLIVAQVVILRPSRQLVLSILPVPATPQAAAPLMGGDGVRLHVLGTVRALRIRDWPRRCFRPTRWVADSRAY